jgi:hypothetical protein
MNSQQLKLLVQEHGIFDEERFNRVLQRIEYGADIGCEGQFRCATFCGNAQDAYQNGRQVTDAIASWVKKGFAYGPVDEEDLPADAKVNGILTRQKPDGTVRIILNLSAPKGLSVNDGIDNDNFPAVMSSTEAWVNVLNKAGRGCWISKTDWADAYKHVTVRRQDTNLQWFEWAGKFFKELCLIFGSASSAGIFDDVAKIILDIVCRAARFPKSMVCQHLDDICAAAAHKQRLELFDQAFEKIANQTGVRLAPKDNPEKAFGPSQQGVVFGVLYDTAAWTWAIPPIKLHRLLLAIESALQKDAIGAKEMKSIAGKLINIRPLFPTGKFNMDKVMKALADSNFSDVVLLDQPCKRQLHFWTVMLKGCQGNIAIPNLNRALPPWACEIFTDAAGGTTESLGRGLGGVFGEQWFYYPWSTAINCGAHRVDDKKVARKLSALELLGPLVAVSIWADRIFKKPVRIWVDNAGSIGAWEKGYSASCRLCTTIVKAIATVAAGVGADLKVAKITRCSTTGSVIADHLSKANFAACRSVESEYGWRLSTEPTQIPVVLLKWLQRPEPTDDLGHSILKHISKTVPVLGYTDNIWSHVR